MNEILDASRLLTPSEVAGRLGIPISTLANWRYQGLGPRYLRLGRHVRYEASELEAWLRTQRVRHRGSLR